MKAKAADFLVYDQESGTYREDPRNRPYATMWRSIIGATWVRRSSRTGDFT